MFELLVTDCNVPYTATGTIWDSCGYALQYGSFNSVNMKKLQALKPKK